MLALLKESLENQCEVKSGDRIVVGVSGGPDSLALATGILSLGYQAIVAHLDHGIREESGSDAATVQEFAKLAQVAFRADRVDAPAYSRQHGMSLEEAAREMRYSFLFQIARQEEASAVAVGHNADDQAETILMHFLRGAGLEGLKGMLPRTMTRWSSDVPLVRPMLNIWRNEIEVFCSEANLNPLMDASNFDQVFHRNKIRHSLLPTLMEYNPNFKKVLLRTGKTLQGDLVVLEGLVDDVMAQIVLDESPGHVEIDLGRYGNEPGGLQRRILRNAIGRLRPGLRDIGYEPIEKIIGGLRSYPLNKKIDLIQGLCLRLEDDSFHIEDWEHQPSVVGMPQLAFDRYEIPGEGEIELGGGWCIRVEILEETRSLLGEIESNSNAFAAFLDMEEIGFPLILRVRAEGDRFKPHGLNGHSQKVSENMINSGLPIYLREKWPLLEYSGQVVWIAGYQISEDVRIRESTEKILKISLFQEN